jgi:hypothetical protein
MATHVAGWPRSFRILLALGALLTLMTATAGCAAPMTRPLTAPAAPPAEVLYVIPAGTAAARMRGESVMTVPQQMTLTVGQTVAVRNDDAAMHYFFYAPIAPGQTFRKTFSQAGTFGYSGFLSCSVADFDSLSVEVTPAGR